MSAPENKNQMTGAELAAAVLPAGLLERIQRVSPKADVGVLARLLISKGTDTVMPILHALFPEE